jgi:hypothetical protein
MKDVYWKLNLLQHTTFSIALFQVSSMFDETDNYPLARQTALAGFISEEEVENLLARIGKCKQSELLRMSIADILLLYTVMDLNGKLLISHKGDSMHEKMKLDSNAQAKQGVEGMLAACSAFVKSVTKQYGHLPEFKERQIELERLNAFL